MKLLMSLSLVLIRFAVAQAPETTTVTEQPAPAVDATDHGAPSAASGASNGASSGSISGQAARQNNWIPPGYHYPLGGLSTSTGVPPVPKPAKIEQVWPVPATNYDLPYVVVVPATPTERPLEFPPPPIVTPAVPVVVTPANSSPPIVTPAAPVVITPANSSPTVVSPATMTPITVPKPVGPR